MSLRKTKRRIRDLTHKATRAIAAAFPGATCSVGEPFNAAAQRIGRVAAQQVSTACTRKIIAQLDYKTAGAITLSEAFSSQTCPVCGGSGARTAGYTIARTVEPQLHVTRSGR